MDIYNSRPQPSLSLKRTHDQAMREFEYACRAWFACMPIPDNPQRRTADGLEAGQRGAVRAEPTAEVMR